MGKGNFVALRFSSLVVLFLAVVLILTGDLSAQTESAVKSNKEWVKTEIYLGKDTSDSREITQREFNKFLDKVVTRYFPKGLTVYDAYGQMQEQDKTITKQATWVVVIVHEKTPENENGINAVIGEYRKQFQEPDVMRTASAIEVNFYPHKVKNE